MADGVRLRRLREFAPWVVMAVILVVVFGISAHGRSGPLTETGHVQRIAAAIRCPTCRNVSAADSDAPASRAIRDGIRRRVRAGQSDGEIKAFLLSRYGPDVLLRPEASGVAALVWALPVAAFVCALVGLVVAFRRWRVRTAGAPSAEDRALVERALAPAAPRPTPASVEASGAPRSTHQPPA